MRCAPTLAMIAAVAIVSGCGRRSERAWFDAAPPVTTTVPGVGPLPIMAFHVRWSSSAQVLSGRAGQKLPVAVTMTNTGTVLWPDNATAHPRGDGRYAVRLSYTWTAVGTSSNPHSGTRVNLPHPVAPDASVTLPVEVQVPSTPGDYDLVFELVQEFVAWFADAGAEVLRLRVHVLPISGAG